jgi:hypothetical protein
MERRLGTLACIGNGRCDDVAEARHASTSRPLVFTSAMASVKCLSCEPYRATMDVSFNYGVDTGTIWKSASFHEPILWRYVSWDHHSPDRASPPPTAPKGGKPGGLPPSHDG